MDPTDPNFEEIFQGWLEKEEFYKSKGFLKKNKSWKKYFFVLRRYDGDDNVYLQWFEKEDDWRKEFPVGSFSLFPKYAVYKRKSEKGKSYFEISNDDEQHNFMAANEKTMDLWVIQLMMQTRLNSSMIGNSFRVKGGEGKSLQRIGAKNLNCLLHVSEWGLTLALERTHSVLSQWPLTTIRNYECTDNNEFVFEAGRKSPMGEGRYQFLTNNNEDNAIFDQIDHYTSLRATRARASGNRNRLMSGDEEEIAEAYGKLRWSVMLNSSTLNLGVISPVMSSAPKPIAQNDDQLYNHLQRRDSSHSTATTVVCGSYDRLERADSFNDSRSIDTSYSRLNCSRTPSSRKESQRTIRSPNDSYDHLERVGSFNGSPSSFENRSKSLGSNDGRNRFQFSSPPLEDSYNHLEGYRRSSWSTSPQRPSVGTSPEGYNRLDRSMRSVQEAPLDTSYDRLDSMQDNVFARQGPANNVVANQAISPPRPPRAPPSNKPSTTYDVFGNTKNHIVNSMPSPTIDRQNPAIEELPPPLPQKPSFMAKPAKTNQEPVEENKPDTLVMDVDNEGNKDQVSTESRVNGAEALPKENKTENEPHYQDVDKATESDQDSPRPRSRLDTHSSDSDLRRLSREKSNLDSSKRTTLHSSAPSLAVYSVVKKKKNEKDLSKSGSTFKLDNILKRFGRVSKKEEINGSYEKINRKPKKSHKKIDKNIESTSSLRRLVTDDDEANAYAEINENGLTNMASGSRKMQRSESSKRPLPDLPLEFDMNV